MRFTTRTLFGDQTEPTLTGNPGRQVIFLLASGLIFWDETSSLCRRRLRPQQPRGSLSTRIHALEPPAICIRRSLGSRPIISTCAGFRLKQTVHEPEHESAAQKKKYSSDDRHAHSANQILTQWQTYLFRNISITSGNAMYNQ